MAIEFPRVREERDRAVAVVTVAPRRRGGQVTKLPVGLWGRDEPGSGGTAILWGVGQDP